MRNERLKFILLPIIIISLVVGMAACNQNGTVGSSAASTGSSAASKEVKSNDELYNAAVRDAVFIEDDEILPLVNISKMMRTFYGTIRAEFFWHLCINILTVTLQEKISS